jgi:hypothetical protein
LYIYFGVAALIGLLTGSILHFSSTMLISLLDLRPSPVEIGRAVASVCATREKAKLGDAWQTLKFTQGNRGKSRLGEALGKEYVEFLDKDREKRRELQGLLSQTILEEDDSDDRS